MSHNRQASSKEGRKDIYNIYKIKSEGIEIKNKNMEIIKEVNE